MECPPQAEHGGAEEGVERVPLTSYLAVSTTSICQVSSIIGICETRISVFLSTNTLMHESMPQSPGATLTTPSMERRRGVFSAIVSESVLPPGCSVRLAG